jgi:hypothetical protein
MEDPEKWRCRYAAGQDNVAQYYGFNTTLTRLNRSPTVKPIQTHCQFTMFA